MKKQEQAKMELKYSKIIDPRRKEEIRLSKKFQSNLESWSEVEKVNIWFKIWLILEIQRQAKEKEKNDLK